MPAGLCWPDDNGSHRRKGADFGAKTTSASLPRRLWLLPRFLNSPWARQEPSRRGLSAPFRPDTLTRRLSEIGNQDSISNGADNVNLTDYHAKLFRLRADE